MPVQKIATCCYCGTRAALVLTGETAHELSCASCGAPLHDLKMLPKSSGNSGRDFGKTAKSMHSGQWQKPKAAKQNKRRKPKKRKTFGQRFLEEAFDVIEDIFD